MADTSGLAEATFVRLQSLQDRLNVWDGYAPTGPGETYAVFYPESGGASSTRHGGVNDSLSWGCYLICAGRTRTQVLRCVDLVRGCLLGFRPDPSPAADSLAEVDLGSTMLRDSTGVYSLTLRYSIDTSRTAAMQAPSIYDGSAYSA